VTRMHIGDKEYPHTATMNGQSTLLTAHETIVIREGEALEIEAGV
jgi:hypothetical protein